MFPPMHLYGQITSDPHLYWQLIFPLVLQSRRSKLNKLRLKFINKLINWRPILFIDTLWLSQIQLARNCNLFIFGIRLVTSENWQNFSVGNCVTNGVVIILLSRLIVSLPIHLYGQLTRDLYLPHLYWQLTFPLVYGFAIKVLL